MSNLNTKFYVTEHNGNLQLPGFLHEPFVRECLETATYYLVAPLQLLSIDIFVFSGSSSSFISTVRCSGSQRNGLEGCVFKVTVNWNIIDQLTN